MGWDLVEALILALALAIDAAAVSVALGASGASPPTLMRAAAAFGAAQALMAAAGAAGGWWLSGVASAWDHWVAFTLLLLVGGKMAFDTPEDTSFDAEPSILAIAALALATSIDALVTGITLPILALPTGVSVAIIGVVTAALSGAAGRAGSAVGRLAGPWAMRAAGGVLVLLGCRVLAAHFLGVG